MATRLQIYRVSPDITDHVIIDIVDTEKGIKDRLFIEEGTYKDATRRAYEALETGSSERFILVECDPLVYKEAVHFPDRLSEDGEPIKCIKTTVEYLERGLGYSKHQWFPPPPPKVPELPERVERSHS